MARWEDHLRFILPISKVAIFTVMIHRIFQTELEKILFKLVKGDGGGISRPKYREFSICLLNYFDNNDSERSGSEMTNCIMVRRFRKIYPL
jgi:hypothetical protein